MSSGAMGTSASLQDIKQLLDQIIGLCGKVSVAKKETSQLAGLCSVISYRISDCSLVSQQPDHEKIKSDLVGAEQQLRGWSKLNLPKSLMKKADIEAGVTRFVEGLEVWFPNISGEIPLYDVGWLLEHIRRLCGRISVAKEETSQLAELCDTLSNRLINRSLILQQHNYNDIKSDLIEVEKVLAGWSKPNLPESFLRGMRIEEGAIGFAEKLQVIFQVAPEIQSITGLDREVTRLDREVMKLRETPFGRGTYCEVWEGQWVKRGGEVEKVALKALRTEKSRGELRRELRRLKELRHQNILPFYGIVTDVGPRLCMVSPWQENGNLLVYVKSTPQPNKNYLLRGSAAGLSYLHSARVVHGSVKCKNVFVSPEGEPLVCDFGIARIWEKVNGTTITISMTSGGDVRYIATEHIGDAIVPATTHSDTFSFAMLMLECITEEVPFSSLARDAAVLHARTTKAQCPPRPGEHDGKDPVSDDLWKLMTGCWAVEPDKRPTMEQVHSFFLHHQI